MGDQYGNMMIAMMRAATALVKKGHPEGCPLKFDALIIGVGGQLDNVNRTFVVKCGGKYKEGELEYVKVCNDCPFFTGIGKPYAL